MQNLETIKEDFLTEYDGCCLGATQETSEANKKDILDYCLNKMQAREEELWQKLEEKKEYCNCELYSHKTHISEYTCPAQRKFNQALSEAQSLLDVKEK